MLSDIIVYAIGVFVIFGVALTVLLIWLGKKGTVPPNPETDGWLHGLPDRLRQDADLDRMRGNMHRF